LSTNSDENPLFAFDVAIDDCDDYNFGRRRRLTLAVNGIFPGYVGNYNITKII
jgi:hypothetical protein